VDEVARFERHHRLVRTIHGALFSSGLVAFLISYLFSHAMSVSLVSAAEHGGLRRTIYGLAFCVSIGVIVLRRWVLGAGRIGRLAAQRGIEGVVAHLVKGTILLGAMSEAVILLGLSVSLLTRVFEDMWRLGGIGLVLLLYTYPWRSIWQRAVERARPSA
jgi:uncharacterized membrane protein